MAGGFRCDKAKLFLCDLSRSLTPQVDFFDATAALYHLCTCGVLSYHQKTCQDVNGVSSHFRSTDGKLFKGIPHIAATPNGLEAVGMIHIYDFDGALWGRGILSVLYNHNHKRGGILCSAFSIDTASCFDVCFWMSGLLILSNLTERPRGMWLTSCMPSNPVLLLRLMRFFSLGYCVSVTNEPHRGRE